MSFPDFARHFFFNGKREHSQLHPQLTMFPLWQIGSEASGHLHQCDAQTLELLGVRSASVEDFIFAL